MNRSEAATVDRHAVIERLPASARDPQINSLDRPWIGHEGPLAAGFVRRQEAIPLLARGIAFSGDTTVSWDEAGVLVVTSAAGKVDGETALCSTVLLHPRFRATAPEHLQRLDFLRQGVCVGSHYRVGEHSLEADNA